MNILKRIPYWVYCIVFGLAIAGVYFFHQSISLHTTKTLIIGVIVFVTALMFRADRVYLRLAVLGLFLSSSLILVSTLEVSFNLFPLTASLKRAGEPLSIGTALGVIGTLIYSASMAWMFYKSNDAGKSNSDKDLLTLEDIGILLDNKLQNNREEVAQQEQSLAKAGGINAEDQIQESSRAIRRKLYKEQNGIESAREELGSITANEGKVKAVSDPMSLEFADEMREQNIHLSIFLLEEINRRCGGNDLDVLTRLSYQYLSANREIDCEEINRRILNIDPGNPQAIYLQAYLARLNNDSETSKSLLKLLIKDMKSRGEETIVQHQNLAAQMQQDGNFIGALEIVEQCLVECDQNNLKTIAHLKSTKASSLIYVERYLEAQKLFSEVHDIYLSHVGSPELLFQAKVSLGRFYHLTQQRQSAEEILFEALDIALAFKAYNYELVFQALDFMIQIYEEVNDIRTFKIILDKHLSCFVSKDDARELVKEQVVRGTVFRVYRDI